MPPDRARFALVAFLTLLAVFVSPGAVAATYYVAPAGNDTAAGALATPWRTLGKAAATAVAGDTVFIRAGTYRETLQPAASGTSAAPITFSAYNNETVTVTGFDLLNPGSSGVGQWTQHSGNIWKIQLASAHGFGTGSTGRNQVALDGTMLQEARWPNSAVFADVSRANLGLTDGGSVDPASRDAQGNYNCTYTDSALSGFTVNAWAGATMRMAVGKQWSPAVGTVTASTSSTLTFKYRYLGGGNDTPARDDPYFLFGRLVALDAEGEFFLDDSGRDGAAFMLYVYKPGGGSPAGSALEVRTRNRGLDLSGRSFINVTGLRFLAARVVTSASTANCMLDRLAIDYAGHSLNILPNTGDGDSVTLTGTANTLKNTALSYATQFGVYFGSGSNSCTAENNVIHHCGFSGISTGDARAPLVQGNTVHDTGSFCIAYNSRAGRFLYNHVYYGGTHCTDIGLINAFVIGDAEGVEIAHNWVHDNLAPYDLSPVHGWNGGCGIRADCGFGPLASLNLVVHHNVVWNTTHPGAIVFWGVTDAQWAATARTYAQGSATIDTREFAYHNTLSRNIEYGAGRTGGVPIFAGGGRVKNNLLSGTFSPNGVNTTNVEATNNLVATAISGFADNLVAAAPFVSPLERGFAIPAAAVDAGANLPPYSDGFSGAKPDLGAYESGGPFWIPGAGVLAEQIPALTAAYDATTGRLRLSGFPAGRGIPTAARIKIASATSTAVYPALDLATRTFTAAFAIDLTGIGGAQTVSLSLDGTTFIALAASVTLPGAATGGTGPAAPASRTFRVEPLAGFAIAGNVPNAAYVPAERKVYLIYSLAGAGARGIVQATSADGISFADTGVVHAGLTALLSPVGRNGVDIILRLTAAGTKRYFAGGLSPADTTRYIYRADADAAGALALTTTPAYIPSAEEGAHAGVPEIIATRDGRWRMFYNPVPAARNNVRTAVSADEGVTWTYEGNNSFGDFAAPQGASTTNVDPCPFRLADGTYLAVTMRAARLYFWNSDDGFTFTEIAGSELTAAAFPAAPGANGLFDPTMVQLPDGTIYLYATAGVVAGAYAERIVAARIIPSAGGVATAPVITAAPVAQTTVAGGSVTLSVAAIGAAPLTYQWRKDGAPLPGATSATLAFSSVRAGDAGSYTVTVSNGLGSVTSGEATVTVTAFDPGRLINLSILTSLASGQTITLGTVLGGAGTQGSKPLLIRAAGPSLAQFGVTAALADPKLDLFSGQAVIAASDNWGGTAALSSAFAQVGAFPFASVASTDAAVLAPALVAGNYSVQISGVGGASGAVIAELYDATPNGAFADTTVRLVNVSVLKPISAGEVLTAGFVIGGNTPRQVLLRAVGPTLGDASFNVAGALADPKIELFRGQAVIDANDNWGGGATLSAAFGRVGAFALGVASKDAVLLATLSPGSYTAQVTGVGGGIGMVLVEVYELP